MAKGQASKTQITEKILNTFEGSFICNQGKEIRIPMMENGELVQIKVTLTAAKDNISEVEAQGIQNDRYDWSEPKVAEVSQTEKNDVINLAKLLNL